MTGNGTATLDQIKDMADLLPSAERQELLIHLNRPVEIQNEEAKERNRQNIDRILEVVESPPHIPVETIDELMRIINQGKRPAESGGVFDDLIDHQE